MISPMLSREDTLNKRAYYVSCTAPAAGPCLHFLGLNMCLLFLWPCLKSLKVVQCDSLSHDALH